MGKNATNLQRIRKNRGLTQTQLAQLSGISVRTIECVDCGRHLIDNSPAIQAQRLADALECSVKDLLENYEPFEDGKEENKITKNFENRIMNERTVDTKTYRYHIFECGDHAEIRRIELKKLNTTEAINGWEVVKVIYA